MSRTTVNRTFGTPVTGFSNGVRTRSGIRVLPLPDTVDGDISVIGSAGDTGHMTPAGSGRGGLGISHVKNLLEQKLNSEPLSVEDKSSPGLARLRMTPGGQLKQKQQLLMRKHEDARKQSDRLNVGGGVTLWPEMEDMRLDQGETVRLIAICAGLLLATVTVFSKLHGSLLRKLWPYGQRLVGFSEGHRLDLSSQEAFRSSLLIWHSDYRKLLGEMNDQFDMSRLTAAYQLYILIYVAGVGVLLYFLLDNMFSTNKLSPRRIKAWVSLLTVIGSWTLMMTFLLVTAQQVESAVETNVVKLTETLADIVETDLDPGTFHSVLLYWRTRCLPPTTHGLFTILGVVPVRDVMMYIQYYSLPVIMALVTPIVRLVMALVSVYRPA